MKAETMRQLTLDDIEFTIECLPEDIPVRGNYMVTDDPEADRAEEDKILRDLEWNEWAWCCVKVTGRFKGLKAVSYLGLCTYNNEQDFIEDGWDDMRRDVMSELQEKLNDIVDWSTTATQ